jgi:hypothetical protein
MGQLNGFWKEFGFGIFGGQVQRRGARVNIPEIGSRDGEFGFWGNLCFHADLRRE